MSAKTDLLESWYDYFGYCIPQGGGYKFPMPTEKDAETEWGPFRSINACTECGWWRVLLKSEERDLVCPDCGEGTEEKTGRFRIKIGRFPTDTLRVDIEVQS